MALGLALVFVATSARVVRAAPFGGPRQDEADRSEVSSEVAAPRSRLDRSASELPRAEAGRWRDWQPAAPPPIELRETLSRGARAYASGDLPAALDGFWDALERAPDYPPLAHQVGVLYFKLRRYGDAAEMFERFLAQAPTQLGATRALGHCYYSLGDYERARAHYRAVLEVAPEQAEAVRGLALTEMRLGNSEAALELLDRVLKLEPDHAEALTWRAQILHDEERLEEALEAALRARVLAPFDSRPPFLLSRIYFELEREEEGEAALAEFERLDVAVQETRLVEAKLMFEPREPALWARLARARASIRDVDGTRAALRNLMQLDPRDPVPTIFALDLLESIDDAQGAAVAARALETNCGHVAESWKRLERYFGAQRDRVRQVQAGERYLRLKDEEGNGDSRD